MAKKIKKSRTKRISAGKIRAFRRTVYGHYRGAARDFPWRKTRDPYRILVSEIMLQQTQTARVLPKYKEFVRSFPNFRALAAASTRDVLRCWSGLGYNRRALALKSIAEQVVERFAGQLPDDEEVLQSLKGIGPYTAAAISAFVYDRPTVLIETNVRSVFIHFFFAKQQSVHDREILPLIERCMDRAHPREWYYALMDYGVKLKKEDRLLTGRGIRYKRQPKFEGSRRQVRGRIVRALTEGGRMSYAALRKLTNVKQRELAELVSELQREGFIKFGKSGKIVLIG